MLFCRWIPRVAVAVVATVAAGIAATVVPADAQPALHHVRYTVGASQDIANAEIYYRDVEPPNWADYSHNSYLYTPNVEANLGPGKPWVLEATLANPDDWALVVVGLPGALSAPLEEPGFVCELRVDDVVVATDSGSRGALCSIRPW